MILLTIYGVIGLFFLIFLAVKYYFKAFAKVFYMVKSAVGNDENATENRKGLLLTIIFSIVVFAYLYYALY